MAKRKIRELDMLRVIQGAMPDPYYVRDMDYNIVLWPPAIQELTGYSAEEAKHMKCFDIFKAEVCSDCPTQRCIEKGQFLKDVMVDVFHKNGDTLTTLVSNAGVYSRTGRPIGAVEIVKNYTQQSNLITSVMQISEQLAASTQESSASIEEVASNTQVFDDEIHQIGTTIEGIDEIASGIAQQANEGHRSLTQSVSDTDNLYQRIQGIGDSIGKLGESSQEISSVITTIKNITEQTSLLALNAAIESARAGEHGRGVAVVADEVRKLAEESAASAGTIEERIGETLANTDASVEEMTKGSNEAQATLEAVKQTDLIIQGFIEEFLRISENIKGVVSSVNSLQGNSESIASATQQQSSVIEEIAGHATKLQKMSEELINLQKMG